MVLKPELLADMQKYVRSLLLSFRNVKNRTKK